MKFDEVTVSTDEMDQSSGPDEFIGISRQMAKRKRTKRQRRITISGSCSSDYECVRSRKDDRHIKSFVTTLSEEEENMANCLILLAQSGGGLGVEENEKTEKKRKSREQASEISAVPGGLNVAYECKTCNKAFQSFQALGGHRASHHKKAKQLIVTTPKSSICQIQMASDLNKSTDSYMQQSSPSSKVHECSICGLVFLSGQALGGHMRRHRAAVVTSNRHQIQMAPAASDATTAFATVESLPHEDFLMNESCIISTSSIMTSLDLNLPAPPEEDQVVSDHERRRFINQHFVTSQNNRNPATTSPPLVGCYF